MPETPCTMHMYDMVKIDTTPIVSHLKHSGSDMVNRLDRAPLDIWYRSYLTIGWSFWVPCRRTTNLMACVYRLKCSPSAHIKKILKSSIFFFKNEI